MGMRLVHVLPCPKQASWGEAVVYELIPLCMQTDWQVMDKFMRCLLKGSLTDTCNTVNCCDVGHEHFSHLRDAWHPQWSCWLHHASKQSDIHKYHQLPSEVYFDIETNLISTLCQEMSACCMSSFTALVFYSPLLKSLNRQRWGSDRWKNLENQGVPEVSIPVIFCNHMDHDGHKSESWLLNIDHDIVI